MDTLPRGFVQIARLAAAFEAGLRSVGADAFLGHAKRLVGFWSRSVRPPEPVAGVRPGRLVRNAQGPASDALEAHYVGQLQRLMDASTASPGSTATASAAAALRDALQPVALGGSALTPALQSAARRLTRLLAVERPAEHQHAALRFLEARPREPLDAREWLVFDLLFGGAQGPVEPADVAHLSDAGFARCEELEVLFDRHCVLRPCDGRAWPSLVGLPIGRARKLLGALPPLLCLLVVDGAPCANLAGQTVRLPGFDKVPRRARVEQAWVVAFSALEARAMCAVRDGLDGDEDQGRWMERVDPHRLDTARCRDLASSRDAAIAAFARAAQEAGRTRDQILAEIVAARVEAATKLPGISCDGLPHEVLRHYLAIGRPGLGANSEHLFVRQGGGPMSEGRVARILGWDVADADVRPRAMQLRNGRGAFLMLGAARGDGGALDRLGDGAAPHAFWQRVLDERGWPWPYVETARRRLPHASWDLALVRALLGLPPGHPFRRQAADALQRQPTWCEQLEPELAARGLFEGSAASIAECAGALQRETDPGHLMPLVAALADTLVVAWLQGRSDLAVAWAKALLPLWPRALQGRDPAVYRLGSVRGDQWFATREDALASLQAGDVELVGRSGPARVAYGELPLDEAPDAVREAGLRLRWTSDRNHSWQGVLPRLAEGLGVSWRSCPEWVGDVVRSGLQQGQPFWCASLLWWLAEDADSEADDVFKEFLEGALKDLLSGMAQGWTEGERARFVLLAHAHAPDAPAELGAQFPDLGAASAFFVEEPDRARVLSQRELGVALRSAPKESWPRVERILQSEDLREVVEPCLGGLVQHVLACCRQGEVEVAVRWAEQLLGSWEPQLRGRCAWASLASLEFGPQPALERLLGCVLRQPNGGLPDEVLRSVCHGDAPLWAGRSLAAAVATSPRLVVTWILDGASGRHPSTERLEGAAAWARDAGYLDAMDDGDRALLALRLGARCDSEGCPVLASLMHSPAEAAAGWILGRPEVAVRLSPDELVSLLFEASESAAMQVACHPAARDAFVAALGPLCVRLLSDSERSERHSRWASFLLRSWAPQLRSLVASVKIRDHRLTAEMSHGAKLLLASSSWGQPVDAGGDPAIEDLLLAMMRTRQGWVREWVWTARFARPEDAGGRRIQSRRDIADGATPECLAEAPPAWVAPALARLIDAEPVPMAGSLARWLERHPSKVARYEALPYEALATLGRSAEPEVRLALARRLLAAADVPARLRALAWEMCDSLSVQPAAADQLLDAVLMRSAAEFLELLRAGVADDAGPEQAQARVAWLLDQGLAARLGSLGQGAADAPPARRDAISVEELCEQGFEPDGVVALADVARLLPRISAEAWPDCEARLIARLESAPDAGRLFWETLLDGIRDETLPADLVTDEARAQLRASFARCAAPETFGAVPPAAEVLATEWLAARGAAITEQADLLVLVAGHALASVRAHALGALAAASLTTSQLLRAAESGHADVGAAVAARLDALRGDELNESLAAMLDSPVEPVRALAIARLREAPSLSATAAVAPALLSSPHRDVEAWALAQLETGVLGADLDQARLQELVMTRLRGGAGLRAAVRARVARGAEISTSLLLRIARGPHRVDAEWAATLLVERALAGQSVPAIQLLDSEVGEDPCN